MIIECINCDKKFEVNSDLIPSEGRTIQCGSCNHIWFFDKNIEIKPKVIQTKTNIVKNNLKKNEKIRNNLIDQKEDTNKTINIKVRSTGRLLKAKINVFGTSAEVEILDKETGISPGQACVFYLKDDFGDKVLGGGWIHKTFNKNLSTKLTV